MAVVLAAVIEDVMILHGNVAKPFANLVGALHEVCCLPDVTHARSLDMSK